MIVKTADICNHLLENGFIRDDSQQYGYAGYRGNNGEWLVIDEQYLDQDTDHLIDDCVSSECYTGAAIIKAWVEKARKMGK